MKRALRSGWLWRGWGVLSSFWIQQYVIAGFRENRFIARYVAYLVPHFFPRTYGEATVASIQTGGVERAVPVVSVGKNGAVSMKVMSAHELFILQSRELCLP